jgi:hypothetical protein
VTALPSHPFDSISNIFHVFCAVDNIFFIQIFAHIFINKFLLSRSNFYYTFRPADAIFKENTDIKASSFQVNLKENADIEEDILCKNIVLHISVLPKDGFRRSKYVGKISKT